MIDVRGPFMNSKGFQWENSFKKDQVSIEESTKEQLEKLNTRSYVNFDLNRNG
jgi:hypothetical protein